MPPMPVVLGTPSSFASIAPLQYGSRRRQRLKRCQSKATRPGRTASTSAVTTTGSAKSEADAEDVKPAGGFSSSRPTTLLAPVLGDVLPSVAIVVVEEELRVLVHSPVDEEGGQAGGQARHIEVQARGVELYSMAILLMDAKPGLVIEER